MDQKLQKSFLKRWYYPPSRRLNVNVMLSNRLADFQICEISLADSVWNTQTHHHAECRQNRLFLWGDKNCDFSNFQNGRCRHLGFLKSQNFISYWGAEGRVASACQISQKNGQLVANILRLFDFSRWRPSAIAILDLFGHIWTTHSEYLGVSRALTTRHMC